jgi:hypothetical protein
MEFRLPTWLLQTTKPYDSRTPCPKNKAGVWNTKWFSQRPLLSRKQGGHQKHQPTFPATLCIFVSMSVIRCGRWRCAGIVACSRCEHVLMIDLMHICCVVVDKWAITGAKYRSLTCIHKFHWTTLALERLSQSSQHYTGLRKPTHTHYLADLQ